MHTISRFRFMIVVGLSHFTHSPILISYVRKEITFLFLFLSTPPISFSQLSEILQLDSIAQTTNVSLHIIANQSKVGITSVLVIIDFPGIVAPSATVQELIANSLDSLELMETPEGFGVTHSLGYKGFYVGSKK